MFYFKIDRFSLSFRKISVQQQESPHPTHPPKDKAPIAAWLFPMPWGPMMVAVPIRYIPPPTLPPTPFPFITGYPPTAILIRWGPSIAPPPPPGVPSSIAHPVLPLQRHSTPHQPTIDQSGRSGMTAPQIVVTVVECDSSSDGWVVCK